MTAGQVETREFKAETKRLLDLMINSIYTNQEIFLRELIANASDAIDKIKFRSLTNVDILEGDSDFEIWLDLNQDDKTFTISDNGVGMTHDEVIENIGTIAQSGSKKFLEELKKQKEAGKDMDLIGQFGVGFYSAFMVADKVTLITKAAGEERGVKWESTGDGTYTIEDVDKEKRGTTIKLKLREEFTDSTQEMDLTNRYTIKNLVEKYSNYVRYPVKMEFHDEEENEIKTLNSMTPLWVKKRDNISDEEYNEFYKNFFQDWNEPLEVMHRKAEGLVKFTALLFIPDKAPANLYSKEFDQGIKLYSKNAFVMDNCQELLPDYLNFVRGLVDSPDFSLNISREILQHSKNLKVIGKNLEKNILKRLKRILTNDKEKYKEFWQEFGKAIKSGIHMNYGKSRDKLVELLIFPSSHSEGDLITLNEYVDRMDEEQDVIYYVTGRDRATVEKLPQMEALQDRDLEVLYFFDEIDEFVIENLREYDGIEFKSVLRGDLKLDDKEDKKENESNQELLEIIESHLEGKVSDVRLSKRLKSSAVCLISDDSGMSMSMEKILKEMDQSLGQAKRILEINPDHSLFTTLEGLYEQDPESDQLKEYSELLYSLASLVEGFTPEDPVEFTDKITKLMAKIG